MSAKFLLFGALTSYGQDVNYLHTLLSWGGRTDDRRRWVAGVGDLQFADASLVFRVALERADVTIRHHLKCYVFTSLAHRLLLLIPALSHTPHRMRHAGSSHKDEDCALRCCLLHPLFWKGHTFVSFFYTYKIHAVTVNSCFDGSCDVVSHLIVGIYPEVWPVDLPPPEHLFKANASCLLSTHSVLSLSPLPSENGQSLLYWQTRHRRMSPLLQGYTCLW